MAVPSRLLAWHSSHTQPWAAAEAQDWDPHTTRVLEQDIFLSFQLHREGMVGCPVRYLLPLALMKRRFQLGLNWIL